MTNQPPKIQYLKDYQPSPFLIDKALLHFDLFEEYAVVKAVLNVRRNPEAKQEAAALVLDGEHMRLTSIAINGEPLAVDSYQVGEHSLTILKVDDAFTLETEVVIEPQNNKRLSGLYKSGGNFCTQCESHGFRGITYFLDRPDNLTQFTTTISADKTRYPIMLANGNLTDSRELSDERHWVKWEDPTRKPCYLFALVAGNLEALEDMFITQSGRAVKLAIYVEAGKRSQATYAMQVLKTAMSWDEKVYGREYDLDIYLIVAVSDFNFGAMENKGLNIFNDKYILVNPETATDDDYLGVQTVVAHEYFHNWSGNRVTVRDWFQITLKEGLTVFREHQFAADMSSKVLRRIQEAKTIRMHQFVQDAGPMAHPIYPDSYIEINNFYTTTVYEKGAEVVRMFHTLLGPVTFRKAMDLYFSRNDGYPVTVEEFVKAMEDGSGVDFTQFRRWYKQAGTPQLNVTDQYDAKQQRYALTVTQFCPPTPEQPHKEPQHIPLALGLLGKQGEELPLQLEDTAALTASGVLNITQATQTFYFSGVTSKPLPSLLRDFSAPVKLHYDYSDHDLIFLMKHDSDAFNRWDASQQLAVRMLMQLIERYQQQQSLTVPVDYIQALAHVFRDKSLDQALVAEMFTLPAEIYLLEQMPVADVDAVHHTREWLKEQIAITMRHDFLAYYNQHKVPQVYALDMLAMAQRRLKNSVLGYLTLLHESEMYQFCLAQFQQANNMTDTIGAIVAVNAIDCKERKEMLAKFYLRWPHDPLVIDKWFGLQAVSALPHTFEVVKSLVQHEAFDLKNPNRVRALIGAFAAANPLRFHVASGEGYVFLADYVLKIDTFNPQLAARILEPMIHWRKFDADRQILMKGQLERIAAAPRLSRDVYEIVSKSLL